ncbi:COX15/CtaA family protein [Naasia aerilata]|uniref:Cytochrome b561 n=1 Tax=Naasia aerilata TaxID=1162966 RepID=A0ABN6XTQ8_9MICO|nr:COX15/CtaA family protein [Naasia aerilata]BDZ47045.1 cytochrome b561 [Naasia aerilata]
MAVDTRVEAPSSPSLRDRLLPAEPIRWTRVLAWANLALQVVIIGTGGLVRLTASGLGCPTWPQCTADSLVTTPEMGIHGIIEFGNRLLTFVLVAAAVLLFLAVVRTAATGRRLVVPALLIGLGIPAQGIIGGISVLTQLNPYVVGLHFVVSISLVAASTVLVWRLYHPVAYRYDVVPSSTRIAAWVTGALALLTILVGILTTGSGPHAGDRAAVRNGLDPELLQHVHSWPAYALFALSLLMLVLSRRAPLLRRWVIALLAVEAAQIAVGITQARSGLPEGLVATHMVLASLVAAAATAVILATRQPAGVRSLR